MKRITLLLMIGALLAPVGANAAEPETTDCGNGFYSGGDNQYLIPNDDTTYDTEGRAVFNGTDGPDMVWVDLSAGVETVVNLKKGDDSFCGGPLADIVNGGAGDDDVRGGLGNDRIWGNRGHDSLWGATSCEAAPQGDGDDIIKGGNGDDFLCGGAGDDTLLGGRGDDHINANHPYDGTDLSATDLSGTDTVRCGPGQDETAAPAPDTVAGCETLL